MQIDRLSFFVGKRQSFEQSKYLLHRQKVFVNKFQYTHTVL